MVDLHISNINIILLNTSLVELFSKGNQGYYLSMIPKEPFRAYYTENTVRVYQAYNKRIASEAVQSGTFGSSFKRERMTWIKPSFLWMMYRSGWAEKENQERILAIDITREGFEKILKEAVISHFDTTLYQERVQWKADLEKKEVRCQFDPDRDIGGNPTGHRAIQLGLKGRFVDSFVDEWIVNIEDITERVHYLASQRETPEIDTLLPVEKDYPWG